MPAINGFRCRAQANEANIFIEVKNRGTSQEFSKRILDLIDAGELKCVLSTVVIAEICAGYHSAGEIIEKDDFLAHVVSSQNYSIVDLSTGLADEAGRIRAETGLRLPDAIIAASALSERADSLVSNDLALKSVGKLIRVVTAKEFVEERATGK